MVDVTNINVSKGPLVFLPDVDFQKSNLFFVEIAFPNALFQRNELVKEMIREARNIDDYNRYISQPIFLYEYRNRMRKTILIACKDIDIPTLDIETEAAYPGGRGDAFHLPGLVKYNSHQIPMKIIADSKGYIYAFFEAWMNLVYDKTFNTIGYYDDYVTDMTIYNPESFNLKDHNNSGGMKWLVEDFYPLYIKTGGFTSGASNEGGELDITCTARRAFLDKEELHKNTLSTSPTNQNNQVANDKSNPIHVPVENPNKEENIRRLTRNYNESIQEISKSQILDAGKYDSYLNEYITTPLAKNGGIFGSISNVFNNVADVIVPRVVLETIDTGLRVTRLTELKNVTDISVDGLINNSAKDLALSAISNYI